MVKPDPDRLAPLTITGAVPLDVKVTGWTAGVPTATLPKATVLELTVRPAPAAGAAAATPLPVNWTVEVGFPGELLAITNCAETAPVFEGPNWTFRVAVLLAATVYGNVPAPLKENRLLLTVSPEITTGSELEFTREIWFVAGLPTVTDPNATVVGDAVKLPAAALGVPFVVPDVDVLLGASPPQPVRAMQPLSTTDAARKYES